MKDDSRVVAPKSWSAWQQTQRQGRFVRPEIFMRPMEDVVGQDDLKVKLASAFSQYTLYLDDEEAQRSMVLVYGPSGAGKTFAIEKCVEACGLPYTIASSAAISPPAYKGKTLTDVLIDHWLQHGTDEGVIFLDEVDKWCAGSIGTDTESVSMGVRTQAEVLKYLERTRVTFIDDAKDIEAMEGVEFHTKRLLWIFAGAFVGLDDQIRHHVTAHHFPREEIWQHALPEDFIGYGMLPELTRRVGTWAWVKPLTTLQIMEILRRQERSRWERRFRALDCELDLDESALAACAQFAHEHRTGATGAAALLRRALDDIFVQASRHQANRVRVDASNIRSGRLELEVMDADAGPAV